MGRMMLSILLLCIIQIVAADNCTVSYTNSTWKGGALKWSGSQSCNSISILFSGLFNGIQTSINGGDFPSGSSIIISSTDPSTRASFEKSNILIQSVQNVSFTSINMEDALSTFALTITDSASIYVSHVLFEANQFGGIHIGGASSSVLIEEGVFHLNQNHFPGELAVRDFTRESIDLPRWFLILTVEGNGGGIGIELNLPGTFIVRNSNFTYNSAYQGPGLGILSTSPTGAVTAGEIHVDNCTFIGNTATTQSILTGGGGLTVYVNIAKVNTSRCFFSGNSIDYNNAVGGGAGYFGNITDLYLYGSYFENHTALQGAGAALFTNSPGTAVVEKCTFKNNLANYYNGLGNSGALEVSPVTPWHSLSVIDCYFEGNFGNNGGAIALDNNFDHFIMSGSTFVNNYAINSAANIALEANIYTAVFSNCSFLDSHGQVIGNGIAIEYSAYTLNITIDRCLFNNIQARSGAGIIFATPCEAVTVSNCIFSNLSASDSSGISVQTTIDTLSVINNTFIDNYAIYSGGAIGIVQSVNTITISNNIFQNNSVLYSSSGGAISISGGAGGVIAIDNCQFNSNSAYRGAGIFITGIYETTSVIDSTFSLNSALSSGGALCLEAASTIQSFSMEGCSISQHKSRQWGAGVSLLANVPVVVIDKSTFTQNAAQNGYEGGGVFMTGGTSLSLTSCTFHDNSAASGGGMYVSNGFNTSIVQDTVFTRGSASLGGGLYLNSEEGSNITLSSLTFNDNTAFIGGALYIKGSLLLLQITDTVFDSNSATLTNGGGIFFSLVSAENILLRGLNFFNNSAAGAGGAGYILSSVRSARSSLQNMQLRDNSASGDGGALYFQGVFSNISVNNNQVTGNYAGGNGGGFLILSSSSNFIITSSNFSQNSAEVGGAISAQGQTKLDVMTITGNTINNNSATLSAGGVSMNCGGQCYVSDTVFSQNRAGADGGALYTSNTAGSRKRSGSGNVTISRSNFQSNSAQGRGGALFVDTTSTVTQTNGRYTDNSAVGGGNSAAVGGILSLQTVTMSSQGGNDVLSLEGSQVNAVDSEVSVQCSTAGYISERNSAGKYECVQDNSGRNKIIIGCVIGGVFLTAIVVVALILYLRQQKKYRSERAAQATELVTRLGEDKNTVLNWEELQLIKQIGSGAFGVVYKGKWRALDVAVKQIKATELKESDLADFLAEATLLKNLRPHPNVVLFIGVTIQPQPISLVTEYCGGGGLHAMLHDPAVEMPESLVIHFVTGAAKGVFHLHSEGILHRDLAVRNLLLSATMDVKVTDFGLSKKVTKGESVQEDITGPLKWMSPEALASQEYSTKSDVYSFGVLVWELVTRLEPWQDVDIIQAALHTCSGIRLNIPTGTHPVLNSIMKTCWEHDPKDRPSMSDICHTLSNETEDEKVVVDDFVRVPPPQEEGERKDYAPPVYAPMKFTGRGSRLPENTYGAPKTQTPVTTFSATDL
ncbi:hypothetical protein PROFUN_04647 [Planoprotostelium fungivorum]|uniref:Protein kinase domain-containing protein n=1 Tax=Planoprotostelium fungivorum TaxID=1890364 RepID=A0A2P6NUM2_9EUKA|nr:hypothetical protein PROFUN_04647 [Planoprotostelium fungivorum]